MQPPSRLGVTPCPVLVGRADLLALADRRLATARAGAGHLLFLAGEAGIGKTRLMSDVTARAATLGFMIVPAAAYPRDTEVAGGVLADLAAALCRTDALADVGARIAGRLRHAGGDGDAHRQRRLLVGDLAEAVTDVAATGVPVLITLEDLHWADDLTLEVLDRVARRLATEPILIAGTYRSDELYPRVPMRTWRTRLLTQRLAEEARLPRLGRADTAAMAAAITGRAATADVIASVHDRSDGIPLHIEEFLAARGDPDTAGTVPQTLADAVLARAQALSEPARAMAGAAAVIGRSFDVDLLTAVSGASPERVDRTLRELTDRFFVRPCVDDSTYDFRHALIRDALYADVPPLRRRDLHARTAAAADAAGFGDAYVSDHYERANRPEDAYRHALRGAAAGAAMSAHREAVALYRRAQRTTPTATPVADRAGLLAALAMELAAIDDNAAAATTFAEAHALYRQQGDDTAAAALVPPMVAARHLLGAGLGERTGLLRAALATVPATVDSSVVRARIGAALAAAYMLDRRLEDAVTHGEQARAIVHDDPAVRLNIDTTLGSVMVFAGRMVEGWRLLEDAIAEAAATERETEAARGYRMITSSASVLVEYDRAEHWLDVGIAYAERAERWNDRHYMTAHLAHVLWATGDWTAADRAAGQALADGHGGVTTRISALHVLGYLALGRAETQAAERYLTEARELGDRMAELQRVSPALWGLAETALHSGRPTETIEWCRRGYAASAAVRDAAYLFPYLVTGTRAHLATDDVAGARDWIDRCATLLTYRNIPGTMPALDHALGLLALAEGDVARAREALATAATGWAERRRFWEGTQAQLDQAQAARRARRPAEATVFATAAASRAKAVGAVALLATQPAADTHPLTAREAEVARLVAGGATNREIAAALFVSPKTVAAHVEHILAKLGAARRTEIAAWAADHKVSIE